MKRAWRRFSSSSSSSVRVAVFSQRAYMMKTQVEPMLAEFPGSRGLPVRLSRETAGLAEGCNAVCAFVNDDLSESTVERLADVGIGCIAMRCAGYDRVDLEAANRCGVIVTRVPAYSPYAVAEHSIALCLTLNRQLIKASERVRGGNYTLSGLVGFDMFGKTVGLIGTGKIGRCAASIYRGMGCKVIAFDSRPSKEAMAMGVEYVDFVDLLKESQIISLHCPLNEETKHLVNKNTIKLMRDNVVLINVSRGGLINTLDVIDALDSRKIGALGIDVYEYEANTFFEDLSVETDENPGASLPRGWDKTLGSLATRPNVVVTPHVAFLTAEALSSIAQTTILNLKEFARGGPYTNQVLLPKAA
ncbi:hypothetical protein CTAYLR_000968 [Chrysophaeum taylorii]|uniref:D-lactate dehydrogenase n=1 Tax=Chrysophaeum taylorii TaxID=2483200 RepID=A0AAD7XMM7_9STRA|nr:hypothetical protein CTAYLR_000968 [Chrysophaeum taylorii]